LVGKALQEGIVSLLFVLLGGINFYCQLFRDSLLILTKSEGVVLIESVTTAGGSISRDRLEGMRLTGGVLVVQIVTFPCVVAVLRSITVEEEVFGRDIMKVQRY
jgi:hypothetical protein